VRAGGQRGERVAERHVAQIDAQWGVAEGRVENHAEVGEPADGQKNGTGGRAASELQRAGQLDARRKLLAGRRQIAHPGNERFELCLPAARHGELCSQPLSRVLESSIRLLIGRIQLGRDLKLDDRFLVAVEADEPAAPGQMVLRGAELHAIQRRAGELVVRVRAHGLRVLDDGAVVLLVVLGLLREVHVRHGGGGAAGHRSGERHRAGQPRRRHRASDPSRHTGHRCLAGS
jgi:hypothetical protein